MLPPPASELATPAPQVGSHLKRIDVLRAFAILTVFSQHYAIGVYGPIGYTWWHGWYCWDDHPSWAAWFLRCTLFNGYLGVCLFFVISGFCIRLSQFTHRTFTLGRVNATTNASKNHVSETIST